MICTKCKEERPENNFYLRSDTGKRRRDCKFCSGTRAQAWIRHKRVVDPEWFKLRYETAKSRGYIKKASRKYAQAHKDKLAAKQRLHRARLRNEMIEAYGGSCVCCREPLKEFLTIDHINGDGAIDRRNGTLGYVLYRKLKKLGWPQDNYRLLCMNCNTAIGYHGYCPHNASRNSVENIRNG